MSNNGTRGGFRILSNENDYEYDHGDSLPSWLSPLASVLVNQKSAVETARENDSKSSFIDQINSLITNKPKYSTVEDAVNDYQEKTGLREYLNKVQSSNNINDAKEKISVKAQEIEPTIDKPELLKKFPEIDFFIRNIIKTRHGHIHIPAIQTDIHDIYRSQGVSDTDVNDPILMNYMNDLITKEQFNHQEQNQTRIGDGVGIDKSDNDDAMNSDYFNFATPSK